MDDAKIVELFLLRDEAALQHTSEKYGKRILGLAYGIVKDRETAEECENDTYLEAWNRIPPHEPKSYFYAFLARITRHISLDVCRSCNRLKRSAFVCELSDELEQCVPASDNCEAHMDTRALAEAINGFLGTLSPEKRKIFLRRYWSMDSIADISKRFSISESKVKVSLFRSRDALRQYLEKEGYIL